MCGDGGARDDVHDRGHGDRGVHARVHAPVHAVYPDIGVHADDTAFRGYLKIEGDTGDAECVEFRLAGFPVARKVRERCREHVSCGAHVAFEIQSLHVVFPPM